MLDILAIIVVVATLYFFVVYPWIQVYKYGADLSEHNMFVGYAIALQGIIAVACIMLVIGFCFFRVFQMFSC